MIKCLCVIVCCSGISGPKSGFLFCGKPAETEKEIKDRMSFTAISLIDHIDIFNPPLFSLFDPLPLFSHSHFLFFPLSLTFLISNCLCSYLSPTALFLLFHLHLIFFTQLSFFFSSSLLSHNLFLTVSITVTRANMQQTCALSCLRVRWLVLKKFQNVTILNWKCWSRLTGYRLKESGQNTKQRNRPLRSGRLLCLLPLYQMITHLWGIFAKPTTTCHQVAKFSITAIFFNVARYLLRLEM